MRYVNALLSAVKKLVVSDKKATEESVGTCYYNPIEYRVENYLNSLKRSNRSATIPDLCKRFKLNDDFKMAEIIGELENKGKAVLDGFEPVYIEDGGLFHLAKYTGAV